MIGSPTKPEDHSQHGAYSWRDYFKFNTDHKVIGVQYVGTTFIFFLIGGLFAEVFRAELAHTGMNVTTHEGFNGLMSQHATLMIFTFLVPIFAGIGNFVIPLMLGAPDMAFPRLNALSFWMLPIAGVTFLAAVLLRQLRLRLDGLPDAVGAVAVRPDDVLARASSSPAPRRSRRPSTSWPPSRPCARRA